MNPQVPSAECGFVRVPRSYLNLPVSPGAKTLLLHLCAAANDNGESWYRYEDIGILLGRGKASVVGYVRELVELGLVDAIEQKTANGFNYRRRLKLTQWRSLVAHWENLTAKKKSLFGKGKRDNAEDKTAENSVTQTPKTATEDEPAAASRPHSSDQQIERRGQPVERKDPSGLIIKIHQNKTPSSASPVAWTEADEKAWRHFRPSDKDPIDVGNGAPSPALLAKLEAYHQSITERLDLLSTEDAVTAARTRVQTFQASKAISASSAEIDELAKALAGIAQNHRGQNAVMAALEALWKPHWRKLPTPAQLKSQMAETGAKSGPSKEDRIAINRAAERIWIAKIHLRKRRRSAEQQHAPGARMRLAE